MWPVPWSVHILGAIAGSTKESAKATVQQWNLAKPVRCLLAGSERPSPHARRGDATNKVRSGLLPGCPHLQTPHLAPVLPYFYFKHFCEQHSNHPASMPANRAKFLIPRSKHPCWRVAHSQQASTHIGECLVIDCRLHPDCSHWMHLLAPSDQFKIAPRHRKTLQSSVFAV